MAICVALGNQERSNLVRVLVTGGNGRLGRWVGPELRDRGYDVVSVDRQLPAAREDGIHYRQVEMSDLGQVIGAAAGCNALIHLAAIPNPYQHPDEVVFLNNIGATYHALQAAMTLGIGRTIIASSASAYGMAWARPTFPPLYAPLDEEHPFIVRDPYALSKETDERTAEMFVRRCGMTVIAHRLHWIAEPGEARLRATTPGTPTFEEATNLWGYVDVRDAARAFRLGLEADVDGFVPLNITAADTLRPEPTEELIRTLLPSTEIRRPMPGNASAWSIDRAREVLGYIPEHSWRDDA
jgi:nucleoside-diphosphate-sugar epimerase